MSLRSLQWAAVNSPDEWLGPSYCLAETDSSRYGYKTKDKNIFVSMMNLRNEDSFILILKDLGMLDDLQDNKKFIKEGKNTIGMGYLTRDYHHVWEGYFKNFISKELLEIFNKHGATAVEFLELNELISHPQIATLDLIEEYEGKKFLRSPWVGVWPKVDIFTER
jgi:crotonobetainyl-CoA:carnitine CoA-transferase CaiB-like acyl-CoA transferase